VEAAIFHHRNKVEAIEDPAQESSQQSTSTLVVEAYNSQSTSIGFSQLESVPLSLPRQRKNQHAAGLLLPRETFSERLMSIKSLFNNQVVWGTQYWELSAKKSVIQLAWKDALIVLLASRVPLPHKQVIQLRKRPAATATGATISRKVFSD